MVSLGSTEYFLKVKIRINLFFILLFCHVNAFSQCQDIECQFLQIENSIFAGHLDEAKINTKKLPLRESSYTNQKAYLLYAKIAYNQGDLKGMNSYLPRITDEFPDISYYKNVLYSQYLILNNQKALGYDNLKKELENDHGIQNLRIAIDHIFNELQIIKYNSNNNSEEKGNPSSDEVLILIAQLKVLEPKMELYEKGKFYILDYNFCSKQDTARLISIGKKILAFGEKHQFSSSIMMGNQILANVQTNDTDRLNFLLQALAETKNSQNPLSNYQITNSLMDFYRNQGDLKKAITWGKASIFPQFMDLSIHIDPYNDLSDLYEETRNLDSAFYYQKIGAAKFREVSQKHSNNIREYLMGGLEKTLSEKNKLIERNETLIIGISIFSGILLLMLYFVLRLGRKLKVALKEVKQSNAEFEVFSRILSHDLKAPIFSISKLIGYVIEDEKELDFKSESYLFAAKDACENANLLINNIMTFVRFKDTKISFKDTSFDRVLKTVKSNLHELLSNNDVKIEEIDLPENVFVNEVLFAQLLQNLIQNSVKYRQIEEEPIIQISHKSVNEGFEIVLKDNGIGIPADKTETIIQAFEQDFFTSVDNGIGLGLAISATVMKLHEGTMRISNNPDHGIAVHLRFFGKK
jgi:signal transduction histidine kinase